MNKEGGEVKVKILLLLTVVMLALVFSILKITGNQAKSTKFEKIMKKEIEKAKKEKKSFADLKEEMEKAEKEKESFAYLKMQLQEGSPKEKDEALYTLFRKADENKLSKEQILEAGEVGLKDKLPQIRKKALGLLFSYGDLSEKKKIDIAQKHYQDVCWRMRETISNILRPIKEPETTNILLKLLKYECQSGLKDYKSGKLLSETDYRDAIGLSVTYQLRVSVADHIALKGEKGINELKGLLDDDNPMVRFHVAQALAFRDRITANDPKAEKVFQILLTSLKSYSKADSEDSLIRAGALGGIRDMLGKKIAIDNNIREEIIALAKKALHSPYKQIRDYGTIYGERLAAYVCLKSGFGINVQQTTKPGEVPPEFKIIGE